MIMSGERGVNGSWPGLLTAAFGCGKAPACFRAEADRRPRPPYPNGELPPMVKPEWGTKRTCPKCATRFYDLGKEDPVTCIACSVNWYPEPVLKSKQPLPYEAAKVEKEVEKEDSDLAAEDLEIDVDEEAEENPDDEVDLGGDDDIGVPGAAGDDEEA
jgi:uncharacterized protein (TIGR02300 family)